MGRNKGTKVGLGEFLGKDAPSSEFGSLPNRPKERSDGDDGRFQRKSEHSSSGGYGDRSIGGGFGGDQMGRKLEDSAGRGDGESNWRRGGGGSGNSSEFRDRGGYGNRGGLTSRSGYTAGDRFDDRGDNRSGYGSRGGYSDRGSSRGNYGDRGGDRGGFGSERSSERNPGGERPKFNLSKRTIPIEQQDQSRLKPDITKPKSNPFGGATAADTASRLAALDLKAKERSNQVHKTSESSVAKVKPENSVAETEILKETSAAAPSSIESKTESVENLKDNYGTEIEEKLERKDRPEKKKREPKVINSRAALFGEAPAATSGLSGRRDDRERGADRDSFKSRRAPPPIVNERFAKLADEEREKSRARDERRTFAGDRFSGPPPTQNSRFSKAIEADEDYVRPEDRNVGPRKNRFDEDNDPRGPPPMIQKSRFALAAAEMEAEREVEVREREERRMIRGGGRDMDGPPPIQTNSRFAAAAADREMEKEREMQEREERHNERRHDYEGNGGAGRYEDDRGGRNGGGYKGRMNRGQGEGNFQLMGKDRTTTTFVKPELPSHLQPKKVEEPILPAVEAPLALPGEDEEAARARFEKKRREEKEKEAAEQKKAEEAAAKKRAEEAVANEKAKKALEAEDDLLETFVNSGKYGVELKEWCQAQKGILPSVEKLVFHLLINSQKDDPNPACPWAESNNYGAALASLVEDDANAMIEVLFAIQRFCNSIGFPKIENEGLIQAMFRNMYKFDLADEEAFSDWKDDESPGREEGKGKTLIQTMDWFNWLEEDDEEDDESEAEDYE